LDQLHHPPGVEIHAETDAATVLAEMLNRQPQTPRARRAEHHPVAALWEMFIRQRLAEHLVVDLPVVDLETRLRNARCAARFEHIGWLADQTLRLPTRDRAAAQPLVLKFRKLLQVVEALHFLERVELQLALLLQPEWA